MIIFHLKALEEFNRLDCQVIDKFKAYFEEFENNEQLGREKFKRIIGTELFEFRIKVNTVIYRALGGFISPDFVIVVIFKKQSQKTPEDIIRFVH